MTLVEQMYSLKDTLKTKIDIIIVDIVYKKGEDWGTKPWKFEKSEE